MHLKCALKVLLHMLFSLSELDPRVFVLLVFAQAGENFAYVLGSEVVEPGVFFSSFW